MFRVLIHDFSIFTARSLPYIVHGKTPVGEMQHSLARYSTNARYNTPSRPDDREESFKILSFVLAQSNVAGPSLKNILRGVKNHLFFPDVYLSSNAFLTVFFASSR
jgi:hypothetical protein